MPNFVWTAKDENGEPVVIEIAADTVEASKARLLADGHTELALKENEVMSAVRNGFHQAKPTGKGLRSTARDRLERRNKPLLTLGRRMRQFAKRNPAYCIAFLLITSYALWEGDILWLAWVILVFLGVVGWLLWSGLPGINHKKLLKALDWHRWDEVLWRVKKLRLLNHIHFIKIPETTLTRYRAKALAGLGKLPQALSEYAVCENQPGCPSWLYKSMVADIYATAGQHDQAVVWVRKALEEQKISSLYLGLANRLVRCKKDLVEAKAALAEAEKGELIEEIQKPKVLTCHGVIASLEGDDSAAKCYFLAALKILEETPHMPFRDGHINKTKARLSCALARQGYLEEAKKHFAQAKKYLVATQATELLEECRQALGAPSP